MACVAGGQMLAPGAAIDAIRVPFRRRGEAAHRHAQLSSLRKKCPWSRETTPRPEVKALGYSHSNGSKLAPAVVAPGLPVPC